MQNPFPEVIGLPGFALTDRLFETLYRLRVLGRLGGMTHFDGLC